MPGNMFRTGSEMLIRVRPSAAARASFIVPIISTTQTRQISSIPSYRMARPRIEPSGAQQQQQRRNLFIRTESTPNSDAIKFLPGVEVKPTSISSPFIEYLTPRSTISPPYPSPLASKIMSVDGVRSVFYGAEFITVTKAEDAIWDHMRPEIFALVTEAVTAGEKLVTVVEKTAATEHGAQAGEGEEGEVDSLAYNENDSEVVGMIKELLETRIRPTIQQDGGDIDFVGFEGGQVMLKLRGACRTCDSSAATLKDGIEKMLIHYIEEVEGVTQVLDKEEEISIKEFTKFEQHLKHQQSQGLNRMY